MPIRFSTEAANADFLADDNQRQPEGSVGASQPVGADGGPRRFLRGARERLAPSRGTATHDQGKPGKDINAAGYLKDKDPRPT